MLANKNSAIFKLICTSTFVSASVLTQLLQLLIYTFLPNLYYSLLSLTCSTFPFPYVPLNLPITLSSSYSLYVSVFHIYTHTLSQSLSLSQSFSLSVSLSPCLCLSFRLLSQPNNKNPTPQPTTLSGRRHLNTQYLVTKPLLKMHHSLHFRVFLFLLFILLLLVHVAYSHSQEHTPYIQTNKRALLYHRRHNYKEIDKASWKKI